MRAAFSLAVLVLLGCETVDPPRRPDSSLDVDLAMQGLPLKTVESDAFIEITLPRRSGLNPALVPPVTTFRWRTISGVEDPDSVRWVLEPADDGYAQALADLRTDPESANWSPWHAYDPSSDVGTYWTTPPLPLGPFVLAVQGKLGDVIGGLEFDERYNARRIRVSMRSTGPLLILSSDFMAPVHTSVLNTPHTILDLPGGTEVEFCWTADASPYGGIVTHHRYGWDPLDVNDDSQWDVGLTSHDGSRYCSGPRRFFFGTHTFYAEAVDNSGFGSRIPVRINFAAPPLVLPLDIRPGSCPNPLNPRSRGVFWVALPGSGELDVHDVDASTVSLWAFPEGAGGVAPAKTMIRDVTSPPVGGAECECSHGHDGFDDLSLLFSTREIG
jgi:hypothetical protein